MTLDLALIEEDAAHTAYVIRAARRREWPYPHLLLEEVLPAPVFEAVRDLNMSPDVLNQHAYGTDGIEGEAHLYSIGYDWQDLEKGRVMVPEIERVYRVLDHPTVKRALVGTFAGELAKKFETKSLGLGSTLMYVEDATGYELLPHTDSAVKAITLLIYLAREGDNPAIGTEIYVPRDPALIAARKSSVDRHRREDFLRVNTVPFTANAGLAFAPSDRTFHGVSTVTEGSRVRRLMQYQLIVRDGQQPEPGGA